MAAGSSTMLGAVERGGHRFTTDTDTETLAHLIEDAAGETLEARVIAALALVEGTYGLAVVSATPSMTPSWARLPPSAEIRNPGSSG